jgi:LysM repeat protein
MKKRYVLKNRTRFSTFVIVVMVIVTTILLASTVYGYKESSYKTITVKQGDTLWNIAKKNNTNKDIRRFVYEIKKVNNMNTSEILSGQELQIPVE